MIACSALSMASMQPTTKDARSRFITFSLPAFSLQNICRAISACRFCAASLYSGLIPEIALSDETTKKEKNIAIKMRKRTRLKLLLLFLSLQSQFYQPAYGFTNPQRRRWASTSSKAPVRTISSERTPVPFDRLEAFEPFTLERQLFPKPGFLTQLAGFRSCRFDRDDGLTSARIV